MDMEEEKGAETEGITMKISLPWWQKRRKQVKKKSKRQKKKLEIVILCIGSRRRK